MNCTKSTGLPVLGKASNKQSTFYLENIKKDIFFTLFNRPGVSGVVLQRPPLLTDQLFTYLSDPFPQNHLNIITPKPKELES